MKIAVALVCALIVICEAKKKKSNDWDELETLLENIDEKVEESPTRRAPPRRRPMRGSAPHESSVTRHWDEIGEAIRNVAARRVEKNPCEDHICGWGKECIVDKSGEPTCECIPKCPPLDGDPFDQVCSNTNETFPSLCELYRERCLCKRKSRECTNKANAKVHLEYLGACKQLDPCTDELMEQFPARMADWLFQVMRELKKRRELNNLEWEELIAEAENDDDKKHVYPVIWKFCDLDIKPHDKHVSHHELIPITAPVIPMESCIKPFLENCDTNNDGNISIREWGKCLGLKEGEIQERC